MKSPIILAAALAALVAVPAANALTVYNSDKETRTFAFMPKHGKHQHIALKRNHWTKVNCSKGCELSLGKSKAMFNAKTEKVWIKGGKFVGHI
jgi:predicted porin